MGCYPYHVCNELSWFSSIDYDRLESVGVVSDAPTSSSGIGMISTFGVATLSPVRLMMFYLPTSPTYIPDQPRTISFRILGWSSLVLLLTTTITGSLVALRFTSLFDFAGGVFPMVRASRLVCRCCQLQVRLG